MSEDDPITVTDTDPISDDEIRGDEEDVIDTDKVLVK